MPPKNLTRRILVIDDEPSITDALRMVLTDLGHHVDSAKTGAEAKDFLKGSPYDLVFTDLRLPDASGIDLLALIKGDTPDTEVIVMTAHGSLDITIEAIKCGAFYFIEKPFTPHQVTALVERPRPAAALLEDVPERDRAPLGHDRHDRVHPLRGEIRVGRVEVVEEERLRDRVSHG